MSEDNGAKPRSLRRSQPSSGCMHVVPEALRRHPVSCSLVEHRILDSGTALGYNLAGGHGSAMVMYATQRSAEAG